MSQLVERVLNRYLKGQVDSLDYHKLQRGISSSETYKVSPTVEGVIPTALAVTIISDPSLWWKIEQEFAIHSAVGSDSEVPIPHLFDAGFDDLDGRRFAFIIREFISGRDLDAVLESELIGGFREKDTRDLATDLGYRLAALHRHRTSVFGIMGRASESVHSSWGDFILGEIIRESRFMAEPPSSKYIGSVKVFDILNVLPSLHKMIEPLQSSLYEQRSSSLSHGDAHFHNFIAGLNENNSWRIKSMIDMEEALGGDPEIDIAFIENWLHFSSYKQDFYRQKDAFASGYSDIRQIAEHYSGRRLIYHALRSLSYLRTVFSFDTEEFLRMNPKNSEYVRKHLDILRSLANGYALEDLEIHSLV